MAKKAQSESPKKQIVITSQANDFIFAQPLPVVSAFMDVIHRLEVAGYLAMPDARKIRTRIMKTTTVSEGISNWERMKALVAEARLADPSLARRSARFSAALNRRQDAVLGNIAQHPESRAAKDYARATGPAFA